jgi:hypothetical protein
MVTSEVLALIEAFISFMNSRPRTAHARSLFVNDFCEDVDDFLALAFSQAMSLHGLMTCLGVVVATEPEDYRSTVGRAFLNHWGMQAVPVVSGRGREGYLSFFETPFSPPQKFEPAVPYMIRLLESPLIARQSVSLVIMAPMLEISTLLLEAPQLVVDKIREVHIMGGIELNKDGTPIIVDGKVVPDTAKNNFHYKAAGDLVYHFFQDHGIPMRIVTRHASYASALNRSQLERTFEGTGSTTARMLSAGVKQHLNSMWLNWCSPLGSRIRRERNMPDRQNREMFIKAILQQDPATFTRTAEEPIDDLVASIPVYDVLSVAWAAGLHELFAPVQADTQSDVQIVGLNAQTPNIPDVGRLRDIILGGLLYLFVWADLTQPSTSPTEDGRSDRRRELNSLVDHLNQK